MRELLFITIVLVCPLMMIWMMRGHGHANHPGGHDRGDTSSEMKSAAALRRQRHELDRLIEKREAAEETPTLRSARR